MNKALRAIVCVSALIVVIFLAGCLFNFLDGSYLYTTQTYEISEGFSNISIDTDTSDIAFVLSDDEVCRVSCYEKKLEKHTARVQDGTLMIWATSEKEWYHYVGIDFGSPMITVYLPKSEYAALVIKESTGDVDIPSGLTFDSVDITVSTGDVSCRATSLGFIKIATDTGSVCVEDARASSLAISVSTGRVSVFGVNCSDKVTVEVSTGDAVLTDVTCKSLATSGSTGDVILKSVIVTNGLFVERSTGDVRFDGSDASEIFVETDTGDVSGTLLSNKVFITRTSTGTVDVPETVDGGRCNITTSTGDIKIEINY